MAISVGRGLLKVIDCQHIDLGFSAVSFSPSCCWIASNKPGAGSIPSAGLGMPEGTPLNSESSGVKVTVKSYLPVNPV